MTLKTFKTLTRNSRSVKAEKYYIIDGKQRNEKVTNKENMPCMSCEKYLLSKRLVGKASYFDIKFGTTGNEPLKGCRDIEDSRIFLIL